jgi:thiol peroxidase
MERKDKVTMKGGKLILLGHELKNGDIAPNFKAVDSGFKRVQLSDFKEKKVLISAVPSLDTGVCALQTKRFNEEAAKNKNVVFITISADLPFAQKRFCDAEKIQGMNILCDSVWHDFGTKYGVLVKDMGLLSRSVFIISPDGKIQYIEIVGEITNHPDYDAALNALK